jgi:hypothetical protein
LLWEESFIEEQPGSGHETKPVQKFGGKRRKNGVRVKKGDVKKYKTS